MALGKDGGDGVSDTVARAHVSDKNGGRAAHGRRDGDRARGAVVHDGDGGAGDRGERRRGSSHQVDGGVDAGDRVAEQDVGQLVEHERLHLCGCIRRAELVTRR